MGRRTSYLGHNLATIFALLVACATGNTAAMADPVADFYKGRTVTISIGNPPGGTYDLYARQIAKYLGAHIPGSPTVIVQNMPGAASLTSAMHVFSVAAQDGTSIAGLASTLPFQALIDTETAKKIDPRKINWLPSPSSYNVLMVVRSDLPEKTVDDLRNHEVIMATLSPGMLPAILTAATNATLGTKLKGINGHPNLASAMTAMERGEIDGYPAIPFEAMKRAYGEQLKQGKYRLMFQFGPEKSNDPMWASAAYPPDLAKTPEDKMLLNLAMDPLKVGYPFMFGPGVPQDRVAAMRAAFMETFKDPGFVADAQKLLLPIEPVDGAAIKALVNEAYAMPPAVIERMRSLAK